MRLGARASPKFCALRFSIQKRTDSVFFRADPGAAASPNRGFLASFRHPTTPSVSDGIEAAVRHVLRDQRTEVSGPNQQPHDR